MADCTLPVVLQVLRAGDFTLQDVLLTPMLLDCFTEYMASADTAPAEGVWAVLGTESKPGRFSIVGLGHST